MQLPAALDERVRAELERSSISFSSLIRIALSRYLERVEGEQRAAAT